ncbi:unnamed protein product, partial [Linum tenue]
MRQQQDIKKMESSQFKYCINCCSFSLVHGLFDSALDFYKEISCNDYNGLLMVDFSRRLFEDKRINSIDVGFHRLVVENRIDSKGLRMIVPFPMQICMENYLFFTFPC